MPQPGNTDYTRLFRETENFTRAALLPDLDPSFIDEADVVAMLRELGRERKPQLWVRTYGRGGALAPLRAVIEHPPIANEPIARWAERAKLKDFCLVINRIDGFCPQLVERWAPVMRAVIDNIGVPLGGAEICSFIGDYGYTPFGLHTDITDFANIQFHIGPAPKTMWTWTHEAYQAQMGHTHSITEGIEPLLAGAQRYELLPGSFFTASTNNFHIGHAPAICATISLVIFAGDERNLCAQALEAMQCDVAGDRDFVPLPFAKAEQAMARARASFGRMFDDLTGRALVSLALEAHRLSLLSNLGFHRRPLKRPLRTPGEGDAVRLVAPYRLEHLPLPNGQMWIFSRGYRAAVRGDEGARRMLERINLGEAVPITEIARMLGDGRAAMAEGRMILALLHRFCGIDVLTE